MEFELEFKAMERECILQVYEQGPDAVVDLVRGLVAIVEQQAAEIRELKERVRVLESQVNQNSRNSSKPPSSDGFRKPTNSRQPGGKRGGPKGHSGHTLLMSKTPDEVIVHKLNACPNCAASLETVATKGLVKRQVFDLPAPRLVVTEHQAEEKRCPCCNTLQRASFPDGVKAPVQYGDGFAAWTTYLNAYHMLPLDRIGQFYADLTGQRPSEATLLSQLESMAGAVELSAIPVIRENLCNAPLLHTDETGVRIVNKQHWLHVVSNPEWTLMDTYPQRGTGAIEGMGILDTFKGVVVHDCLSAYFRPIYSFEHALCNAHLLRECQGILDNDGHQWAKQMKELLRGAWKLTRDAREKGLPLADETIAEIETAYDAILELGKTEWALDPVPTKTGPRGRKCKSKAANLGQRFESHKESILRFLWDANVPSDNNQAERDIRMTKVKQKVSGLFRTQEGGKTFSVLRSLISSLLKQNLPLLPSLVSVLRGQPVFAGT
ncbi:IS66 family transposase [Alicyclobacillus sp. ALC3]|uniref:IS66 family transposase n=1 Tax=Alicyclobacillus sp. ALC3 TaxID=2796143 RepID=UPI0023799819|nr:IS66 family transposase [Alicyclobacillus sp. ALC3]WDL98824.1 IS66 family transposase [Alicyclobacillus sp. ALC3]